MCLALPAVLGLWDAPDVPVLRGLLFPWLLLPVGCFFSALSLGRRKGVCPLYPAACALLTLALPYLKADGEPLPPETLGESRLYGVLYEENPVAQLFAQE